MFQAKLEDKSLDDELAFEMLLTIRDTADPQHSTEARAQFSELVRRPASHDARPLCTKSRVLSAQLDRGQGRRPALGRLPPLLNELAQNATQNLEQFSEIIKEEYVDVSRPDSPSISSDGHGVARDI